MASHNPPPKDIAAGINYVITAFVPSITFTNSTEYTPFKTPDELRVLFDQGTKICMAIGGWGDTVGFGLGAATPETRKTYAKNVAATLEKLKYDCVDVDWEYPGGNGEDYKKIPNEKKVSEIEAYPLLLQEIKTAIGTKELSIAVPGKEGDMMAFTAEQAPKIDKIVDFVNVMSYDLMNRRDSVTNHHTSLVDSAATIDTYIKRGITPAKLNLGLAFYAKYFTTQGDCSQPTGCPTAVLETPDGEDTGLSGAMVFDEKSYGNASFANVMKNGKEDSTKGGEYYWDPATKAYWTWDTAALMTRKIQEIAVAKKLGGIFAWSLCQDSHDWSRVKAMQAGAKTLKP